MNVHFEPRKGSKGQGQPGSQSKLDPNGCGTRDVMELGQTFGGLVIGLTETSTSPKPPNPIYSGTVQMPEQKLIFQPGTNLGPDFPNDIKMTPYCSPKAGKIHGHKEGCSPDGNYMYEVHAGFDPPAPLPQEPIDLQSYLDSNGGLVELVQTNSEALLEEIHQAKETGAKLKDPKLLAFFGQSDPVKPVYCPPIYVTSADAVMDYIETHNLETLFEHLTCLVCINGPEDPIKYMVDYVSALIEARCDREAFQNLIRVFYPDHVDAMFAMFDKEQSGHLSMSQYRIAMECMGFSRFTLEPDGYEQDAIKKPTFMKEAERAVKTLLRSFLLPH